MSTTEKKHDNDDNKEDQQKGAEVAEAAKQPREKPREKQRPIARRHRRRECPEVGMLWPSEVKMLARQCRIGRLGGKKLRRSVTDSLDEFVRVMHERVDLYGGENCGRKTARVEDVLMAYKTGFGRRLYLGLDEPPAKKRRNKNNNSSSGKEQDEPVETEG